MTKLLHQLHRGVLGLTMGLAPALVHAVAIEDVTFRILPDDYQNADAAALVSGNDKVDDINNLTGAFAGDSWYLLDKTDSSSNEFMGVTFDLSADVGSPNGAWVLSWAETGEPGLPLDMDFVFVAKAANDWGAYLFESVTFSSDPLTGDGTFAITWENRGGNIPDLSHASIYGREGDPIGPEPGPGPGPGPGPVPAPGTVLLLGLALIPLGLSRRRR